MAADPGVARTVLEGHQGIAQVVGLLDPLVAEPIQHKAPDVVEARAHHLEAAAVRLEATDLALVEGDHVPPGRLHLRGVERSLGHVDPSARRTHEAVRQ
jgi:hypothetical protein